MGYSSVQFVGRDATLKAFQNTDCVNWSILQGKQFLFKYEGSDYSEGINMLTQLLKMICESSASEAVYTIRWYERDDLKKPDQETRSLKVVKKQPEKKPEKKYKIFESTPYDGSFNFRLYDQVNERSERGRGYDDLQSFKAEVAEMKTLVQQLIKERNQEEDQEKVSGISGMINGLMDMPEIKAAIAGKVVQLFNGVTSKISGLLDPPGAAKIAGPEETTEKQIQMPADQVQVLNQALTILARKDPELPAHLYKLATIAEKDPSMYNSLIGMLNKM